MGMVHQNDSLKSQGLAALFGACVVLALVLSASAPEAKISDWFKRRPKEPGLAYSNPDVIGSQFVVFEPNNPLLYPDNLDLFHIEAKRRVLGAALISPNRQLMATSEVTLLPQSFETTSRVLISPIGKPPTMQEYLTPQALAKVDKYSTTPTQRNQPVVGLYDIRPEGFYRQYQFDHQQAAVRTILKTDPQYSSDYDARIYHVVDWSPASDSLLLSYREGIWHSGVFKTIPVTVNVFTGESTAYRYLPQAVWHAYCAEPPGCSEQVRATAVYDVRVLGWHRGVDDEILLALKRFEPASQQTPRGEQLLGYYAYNLPQGQLVKLGPTLAPGDVAGHGWVVKFTDRSDPDAPKTNATQVIPKAPQVKKLKPAQPRNYWLY